MHAHAPMSGSHDAPLVVLSILIAILASYTALDLAGRIGRSHSAVAGRGWLAAAALAMGGGVWSMHFVGMLAYQMPLAIAYHPGLTLFSLVVAVIGTGLAFHLVGQNGSVRRILASGLLMGASIAAMHYTGMAAMRVEADLRYGSLLVALSLLIAAGASTVALWLAFKTTSALQRLAASVAMGLAVTGMHYTGMAAASFDGPATDGAHGLASAQQTSLALAVAATTFLILFLGLVASLFDRRFAVLAEREALALRESEEKFRMLYRDTPVPLHSLDGAARIEQVSDAWLGLLRYDRDAVIGRPFADFLLPEDVRDGRPAFWERLLAERALRDVDVRLVRQDDATVEALLSVRVEGAPGGPVRVLGSLVDVTERRRTEEALRQAQKMEAMGQLTGGVAHDFNNLLQVIGGSLDLLERGRDPPRRIAAMRQAIGRGQGLTRQLLAFSRRQSFALAVVDLRQQLPRMREMLDRSLRGDIEILISVAEDVWPVEIDAGEFELAILNLSVNARDAMPSGGRLLLDARNVQGLPPGAAGDGLDPAGAYVRVTVEDTGVGISPEVLGRVFEPFFTTKEVGKGSGLGLSQAYGFARQSGGVLAIDSREGWGTRVTLYLPRTDKLPAVEAGRHAGAAESGSDGGRALLVEDDQGVADVVRALLEQLRYRVTHVASPAEALRAIEESSLRYDVVVSDVIMPGGANGLDLARAVRRDNPTLPVVLMTGYNRDAAVLGGRTAPDDVPLINKPFDVADLARAIEAARTARSAPAPALRAAGA